MPDYNTAEIKRRYAKGQHHMLEWMANTGHAIAREHGMPKATMLEALASGKKPGALTQAQFEDAQRRVAYGRKQHHLYMKHSQKAICRDYRIGDRTLKSIVEDSMSPEDPIRKFLTMRLVA